jgi:putative nucleotidyltransferase with HDIG domain
LSLDSTSLLDSTTLLALDRFSRLAETPPHPLVEACQAFAAFPALADVRAELIGLLEDRTAPLESIVLTVESDIALTLTVLRAAARAGTRKPSIPEAVRAVPPAELLAAVRRVPAFDFFERSNALAVSAGDLRGHAVATQQAAHRVAEELELGVSNTLAVGALVHDVGKAVMAHAYDGYRERLRAPLSPGRRLKLEREEFGVDHAAAGALLLRRRGLSERLAATVEHHHSGEARGDAARIGLADMLAHYAAGQPIDPAELMRAAKRTGMTGPGLRRLLRNPLHSKGARRPQLDPCPLSPRQLEVVRGLRAGKACKQIGLQLGIAEPTVRSHLHNIYAMLGVRDRAQAVLVASERGWI